MDWGSVSWHPVNVGAGRPDNRYAGCTCQSWRYCPWITRPTNPACPEHGDAA